MQKLSQKDHMGEGGCLHWIDMEIPRNSMPERLVFGPKRRITPTPVSEPLGTNIMYTPLKLTPKK